MTKAIGEVYFIKMSWFSSRLYDFNTTICTQRFARNKWSNTRNRAFYVSSLSTILCSSLGLAGRVKIHGMSRGLSANSFTALLYLEHWIAHFSTSFSLRLRNQTFSKNCQKSAKSEIIKNALELSPFTLDLWKLYWSVSRTFSDKNKLIRTLFHASHIHHCMDQEP